MLYYQLGHILSQKLWRTVSPLCIITFSALVRNYKVTLYLLLDVPPIFIKLNHGFGVGSIM